MPVVASILGSDRCGLGRTGEAESHDTNAGEAGGAQGKQDPAMSIRDVEGGQNMARKQSNRMTDVSTLFVHVVNLMGNLEKKCKFIIQGCRIARVFFCIIFDYLYLTFCTVTLLDTCRMEIHEKKCLPK